MIDSPTDQLVSTNGRPPRRRFSLRDAMVLIAALAVGLTLVRYSQMRYFSRDEPLAADRLVYHYLIQIGKPVSGILPILYGLCAVVVATGLRGTRQRREEFALRPGLAACTAALVALLAAMFVHLLAYTVGSRPGIFWSNQPFELFIATMNTHLWSPRAIESLLAEAGVGSISAILAVWCVQRLCGLWKPVAEWPDRLGRAVGTVFLLWMLTPH